MNYETLEERYKKISTKAEQINDLKNQIKVISK